MVGAPRRAGDWSGYPADALDEAWKVLLLNQFHDIIPGSSIHWVNEDCLRDHARIAAARTRISSTPRSGRSSAVGAAGDRPDRSSCSTPRRATAASSWRSRPTTGPSCPRRGAGVRVRDGRRRGRPARPSSAARSTVSERWLENELLRVNWDDAGLLTRSSTRSTTARCLRPERRQRVPTARGQSERIRRVERRHRLPRRRATSPTIASIDGRRARPGACRGALRARVRPSTITQTIGSRADRGGSIRDRGRLARTPQVLEGRVPGRRAREPRDL